MTGRAARASAALGLALASAVAAGLIVHLGRGTTFFYDDWDFVIHRHSGGVHTWLDNHNGHLHLTTVLVYKTLFGIVGLRSYTPYRVAGLVAHLAVVLAVFRYAWRRLPPFAAAAAALPVLFLGTGWQNILWAFQIGFLGSVAAGTAAFLAIDRSSRAGDRLAAALTGLAVVSSGVGIALGGGVILDLLLRREWWRAARVGLGATVAYGMWLVTFGASQARLSNLRSVPRYVVDAAAGATGGLFAMSQSRGRVLAAGLLIAIVVVLAVRRYKATRLFVLASVALVYWTLTGVSRGEFAEPAASRYVYVGGTLVVLVAIELAHVAVSRWPRAISVVWCGVGALSVVTTFPVFRNGAAGLRDTSHYVLAEAAAVEVAGRNAPPRLEIDPQRAPQLVAADYLRAVAALGSPVGESTLRRAGAGPRAAADGVLLRAEGSLRSGSEGSGTGASCVATDAARATAGVILSVPRGGLALTAGTDTVHMGLRRFGFEFQGDRLVPPGSTADFVPPADRSTRPWVIRAQSATAFTLCEKAAP